MNSVNVLHSKHAIKFILLLLLLPLPLPLPLLLLIIIIRINYYYSVLFWIVILGQYIAKSRRLEPATFDKLFAEMSGYFYIQSQLNKLVLTINGFTLGGLLVMYPAYGGANQLWTWGPNDTLVSKMGLVADVGGVNRDTGAKCFGYFPNGGVNQKLACSRLRDSGEKSFSEKKCEKRAGAGERQGGHHPAPFPKSRASSFRFACFNTTALYYLRAWHRLTKNGSVEIAR